MHVPVTAAAAAGTGAGIWLFSYNRENFQYDAGMRFGRFMCSRNMACAQMGQYREDCHGITEMTSAKMDTWQIVNTLFLCVCAALSCAGRIGMHGCAPPGWMCALYSGNIFTSILFNGISLWLDMHGSLRAQCAAVSLLTRKARLPIPSLAQLDQARVFGSSFEQQRATDIFRVPFVKHPEKEPDLPDQGETATGLGGKGKHQNESKSSKRAHHVGDPNTEFGSTERDTIPTWIRDEQIVDKAGGMQGSSIPNDAEPTDVPQHFKLLSQAQVEWWQYDVYARVTMLFGVIQFLFAVSYYSIGTTLSELRGYWISWAMTLLLMAAQVLILRMDILQYEGNKMLPYCEWLGHAAPFFAILAGTMEFRWYWSGTTVTLGWVFVILCFFGHFMLALRMLDVAWPDMDRKVDMPEEPTKQWWPKEWRIPTSFSKALWIVAPPKKLEAGQADLLNEMDFMKRTAAGITCRRRRGETNGVSKQQRRTTPQELEHDCSSIDRVFEWWFDRSVWSQLSGDGQNDLHDLYKQYRLIRDQVDELEFSGGDGPKGKADDLMRLADRLTAVHGRLTEAEATYKTTVEGDGQTSNTFAKTPFTEFSMARSPDLPWQITRVAIIAVAVQWFYMIIVSGVECYLGPVALLKPPGEPPWIRDQKTRSWQPGTRIHLSTEKTPDDYQLFAASIARWHGDAEDIPFPPPEEKSEHGEGESEGHSERQSESNGGHRRLAAAYGKRPEAAFADLFKLLPSLGWLIDTLEPSMQSIPNNGLPRAKRFHALDPVAPATMPAFMSPTFRMNKVVWPALFEPRHLVCGTKASVLITPRGAGALVPHVGVMLEDTAKATAFSFDGTLQHGAIAGAAWTTAGMQLLTKTGAVLSCQGHGPMDGGVWPCTHAASSPVPVPSGKRLAAAAFEENSDSGGLTVALLFEDLADTVSIFATAHSGSQGWQLKGEFHIPAKQAEYPGLTLVNNELFVTSRTGEVHRRHLVDGTVALHRAPTTPQPREFHATCPVHAGSLMHLALRQPGSGSAWVPELFTTA